MAVSTERSAYAAAFSLHRASDKARVRRWSERIRLEGGITGRNCFLDLGCGVGRFTLPLSRFVRIAWGIDHSPDMIDRVRAADRTGKGNAEQCRLGDGLAIEA
jgi:SAM-dependent methyltransferase